MEAFLQNPILPFYEPFAWEQPSLSEKQDEYLKRHYVSYPYGQTTTIAQIQTNTIETSNLSGNLNLSPTLLSPLAPLYTCTPIFTTTGTFNDGQYGTSANSIGQLIYSRRDTIFINANNNLTMASVNLTIGLWLLTGEFTSPLNGNQNISRYETLFSTTNNSQTGAFSRKGLQFNGGLGQFQYNMVINAVYYASAHITIYYIVFGAPGSVADITNSVITAVRIA